MVSRSSSSQVAWSVDTVHYGTRATCHVICQVAIETRLRNHCDESPGVVAAHAISLVSTNHIHSPVYVHCLSSGIYASNAETIHVCCTNMHTQRLTGSYLLRCFHLQFFVVRVLNIDDATPNHGRMICKVNSHLLGCLNVSHFQKCLGMDCKR